MPDQLDVRSTDGEAARAGRAAPYSRNRLLSALPPAEWDVLRPHLRAEQLEVMQVLGEVGEPLRSVYFPETSIISVVRRMRDGTIVEAGTVGREGMAGVLVLADEPTLPATLLGEVPGRMLSIELAMLRELLPQLPTLVELQRRYLMTVLDQVGQTAACNTQHTVQQRCARWLLMTHDQVGSDELLLTHEVLSQMLAVRRAGVTEAAGALQQAGLISYRRGRITVLDRAGLEAAACECYAVVRAHYERLLGMQAPLPDASPTAV
jgi:CRP-like cAMP-binding protein